MVHEMTEIAVFDTGIRNMQAAQVQSQKQSSSSNEDFSRIFSRAKENPESIKPVTKTEAVDENIQESNRDIKPEEPIQEPKEKPVIENTKEKPETVSETEKKEEPVVDEETLAMIQEALEKVRMLLEEMIGASPQEIEETMQALGIEPSDLLQGNLSELILGLTGEEQIGMVMNEDLLGLVQETNQAAALLFKEMEELTGMSVDELTDMLKQYEETVTTAEADPSVLPVDVAKPEDNQRADIKPEEIPLQQKENVTVVSEEKAEENIVSFKDYSDTKKETDTPVTDTTQTQTEVQTSQTPKKDGEETDRQQSFQQQGQQSEFSSGLNQEEIKATAQQEPVSYSDVDTQSIMKQIADYVKVQKNQDMTEMEMQLHPASLGTIKISLTTRGGNVTAQFTAQNETVKQALEAQVTQLRTNLEEQGVKIDAIEVSVASHEMERNLDQNGQSNQEQQNKEADEKINKLRRKNINLRAWANGDENPDEIVDEDMKLTVEMMTMYGNSMDLLA